MRREFAPIDIHFDEHPKYEDLEAREMGVHACAIVRANRTRSDGRIARAWPERRFGKEGKAAAVELVRRGIWRVREDSDYEIVGYLEHNRSRAEIEAKSATMSALGRKGGEQSVQVKRGVKRGAYRDAWPDDNREAQAQRKPSRQPERQAPRQADPDQDPDLERGSSRLAGSSASATLDATLETETPVFERDSEIRPRNAMADGAFGLAVSAFADGVRSVTGKTFLLPANGSAELAKLVRALREFFPDDATRVEQTRANAIAFAKTNRGKLSAHTFIDWLNSPTPPPPSSQDAPGRANGMQETQEAHDARIRREEDEEDAAWAKRHEGAGPPPEPLSVMLARMRTQRDGGGTEE